jgi:hypothetical protein
MFAPVRQKLGDVLLRTGMERALERQQMQRSLLASADPNAPGYGGALAALLTAEMYESAMLWLGWRLQPRSMVPH